MNWIRRTYGMVRSLAMYHGQPWRTRSLPKIYADFVKPGGLAFDVGAHAGNRIGALRKLGARVVAIEPQPDFMALLQRLYGSDREVTLLPIGLAAEPGTLTLHISTATPTLSTFSADWIEDLEDGVMKHITWDTQIEVEVRTLDQLIAEYGIPDFCKIDVEGFEDAVIAGSSQPLPALSVEYLPAAMGRTLEVVDRLVTMGDYVFRTSKGESHAFHEPDWVDAKTLKAYLSALADAGEYKSGDVYARLRAS